MGCFGALTKQSGLSYSLAFDNYKEFYKNWRIKAIREFILLFQQSIAVKSQKRCKLDPDLKIYNQGINKSRIGIEHVFGSLKTFKILAECYRNRNKILGLRFNLIAGIYNIELIKK
ncbi:transposase [Acinetobacter sp.]|uniref:transposase n=1 Tax=Acinetobacter sp. TaxID=472 RepID=UPI003BB06765